MSPDALRRMIVFSNSVARLRRGVIVTRVCQAVQTVEECRADAYML